MAGTHTQCPSRHPETNIQCVRPQGTHDEHQSQLARDAYCQCWLDPEE